MAAPANNDFAKKDEAEKRTAASPIYLRPTAEERKRIMAAHKGQGSLSQFCLGLILERCPEVEEKEG